MGRIKFDDQMEAYVDEFRNNLKRMGIHPVSRPMAVRMILEINREAKLKLKRKNRSKLGLLIE